jgi:hypothetical protein
MLSDSDPGGDTVNEQADAFRASWLRCEEDLSAAWTQRDEARAEVERLREERDSARAALSLNEPAKRRYPCGVDADAGDTCDRCPDPDGCIDASYRPA